MRRRSTWRGRVLQRLEKICQDAAVRLTLVASIVLTRTGRAITEALIAGKREPAVLADLTRDRLQRGR